MRDLLVVAVFMVGFVAALRRPWIGVLLWTWISTMNPHRFAFGFAYDLPLAAAAAGVTLLGLLLTRERASPFKGAPVVWLAVLTVWITVSWRLGLDPAGDYEQWSKVMKIYLMLFVTLALLSSKTQIIALTAVMAGSLALMGIKGGLFTIATAGSHRVYGPPETFIAENNAFAVALIMTIPLLRFLQLQTASKWLRRGLTAAMLLLAISVLGSQSRGALLAILAMALVLWWRSERNRIAGGLLMLAASVALVLFMPESWEARMVTLSTYQQDESAMGRIAAWGVAWNIGFDYPFGVGFNAAREHLFDAYASHAASLSRRTPVAHSIYFQTLGHHGFVGLGIFIGLWLSTWRLASRMRRLAAADAESAWCADLAAMTQVALVGFAVGGAFLDLAYFDMAYNIMVLVVLGHHWLIQRSRRADARSPQGRRRVDAPVPRDAIPGQR